MARRSSSPFDTEEEPELSISALIDVAFLLLIYFIVTTTLQKEEADISLTLPGVSTVESKPVKVDMMTIEVQGDGSILVNKELAEPAGGPIGVPNLKDRLTRYAASAQIAGSEPMIVVDCHDDARQQRFVDVLNVCYAAGVDNVSLTP